MRIHIWNVFFSLFFATVVLYGTSWLLINGLFTTQVPFIDISLMALAIFRLIRLFSYDIITQFIRDWFRDARPNTLAHTLGALLGCPWCTGLWFSFVVVFAYFATPFAWPVILVLALASVASFLQIITNLAGWMAEGKKREVQGIGNSGGSCSVE